MPVSVVAVFHPKPGLGSRVVDAFSEVSPLVHDEAGCELYAVHLEQGGDVVVVVERWSTRADLDAHAAGAPLARLRERTDELVEAPYDVWLLDPVPTGDRTKGRVPGVPA